MCVDQNELIKIMCIRVSVGWPIIECADPATRRSIRVIHAGAEIVVVEDLVLVVEPKRVRNFLARNETLPVSCVVFCRVEVRVVELHGTLRNMRSAYPDRRDAEPSARTVFVITHFHLAACRQTILRRIPSPR